MRILVLFFPLFVSLTASAASPQFDQGVEALNQKNYPQAISLFQDALKQEPENLTAWHNLALSYLGQKDDLKAYAYWRKALVFDPGFRPAKDGLNYLMKTSKINQIPNLSIFETLGFSQMLFVLFLVTFATAALLIRFLKARREGKSSPLTILTLAIIVWVTVCCFTGFKVMTELSVKALVINSDVAARSAPTENGAQLFSLKGGEEIEILGSDADWIQVSSGNLVGWVPKQSLVVLDRNVAW